MTARIFSVLAAASLVATAVLALLAPTDLKLGDAMNELSRGILDWMQARSASWLWSYVELPVLSRPTWLLPASFAMICAGIAGSSTFAKSPNTRHRRS